MLKSSMYAHQVPMPRTEQEIKLYLSEHDAAWKKYQTMSEEDKAIYTKCLRIGVPYRCHPKQGYTSYMLDGVMASCIVKQNPDKYPIPTPVAPEGYQIDSDIKPWTKDIEQGGITVSTEPYNLMIAYSPSHNYRKNNKLVRYITNFDVSVQGEQCMIEHSYTFYRHEPTPCPKEKDFNNFWNYQDAKDMWHREGCGKLVQVGKQVTIHAIPIQDVIQYWSHRLDIPLHRTNKKCNSNYFKICMCDINQDAPEAPKIASKTTDPKPEAPTDQKAKRRAAALKAWATMRAKGIR